MALAFLLIARDGMREVGTRNDGIRLATGRVKVT